MSRNALRVNFPRSARRAGPVTVYRPDGAGNLIPDSERPVSYDDLLIRHEASQIRRIQRSH